MANKQKVVNIVYHYSQGSLITTNQAELYSALDNGWQFKTASPNYALNNPYMLNTTFLGISYIFEKPDDK